MAGLPGKRKAAKILRDGKIRGKNITDKQRALFTALAAGEKRKKK